MQSSKALTAQLLGMLLIAILAGAIPTVLHGAWRLALLQGLAAALFSRPLKQPAWWIPIHLLFLPAALALLTLELPAWLYLLTALLLSLVFWGTIKGDVPLFLSSPAVTDALHQILQQEHASSLIDLGAGIGSVAVPLARQQPNLQVEAWEYAPIPWLITAWRSRKLSNLRVVRMSLWQCELSHCDVVFAFLSPVVMPRLGEKVRREMHSGSLFVSSSFPLPDWQAETVIALTDPMATRLYCYRVP